MASLIHYTNCPCCNSSDIQEVLKAKDFTVSQTEFSIWHCNNCTVRFTQNVPDVENIGPYYQSSSYISHSDTKDGFINKLYHLVRNVTLKKKRNLIMRSTKATQGNILDVGAGTGAFSQIMKNAGWKVTGLEPDETARKVAFEKFNLQLTNPAELFQMADNTYDAITMWHVLEHVHNLHGYLEKYHQILKKKGKLFIAVPNYTSEDAQHYAEFWAAYDVPRHLYHFSPKSMDLLATKKGFRIKQYKPMWFDSFYVSMLSEQYKSGDNLVRAFLQGLLSNLKTIFNTKKM